MVEQKTEELCRWRATSPADIQWIGWDPDHIAFHRPSGCTHFLNAASRDLITTVLAHPADLDEIMAVFATPDNEVGAELQRREMSELLDHLEHLGFVERQ